MCPAVHVVPDGISLFRLSHSSYSFSSSGRRVDGDKAGADIESLKKQLLIVDQRLATLTGRLEVLKAVQQVLPAGKPFFDLAGSERFAKSGSSGDQLREASSINKSLSTLGDVISALASEQPHTPYRNSKLTMLMQDSLGGNAKTLLFVTASIAAFNLDETLTSLTYASRAKAVTNAAQRSADCREIARLKAVYCSKNSGEGKKMSKIRVEKQHPESLLGEFFVLFIL